MFGKDHFYWSIIDDYGHANEIILLSIFFVVVEGVRIATVFNLFDVINEHVRDQFQEVEIFLGIIFWVVFERFIDLVTGEHVKHGVLTVVHLAKCPLDWWILALFAEGDGIDIVIELNFCSLVFRYVLLLVLELAVGIFLSSKSNVELTSDFSWLQSSRDMTAQSIIIEFFDHANLTFIIHIDPFESRLIWRANELLDNFAILV